MMEKDSTEKRHGERIEPQPITDIRLVVQGVARDLINISDHGFGILIDTPKSFHLGQRIGDIRIDMHGQTHRLHGAVAHITRTETGHVLGIRLEINSIEEYRLVAELKHRCAAGPP